MSKLICMTIPTLSQGGMERVMIELSNYAIKKGFRVKIICFFRSEIKYHLDRSVEVEVPDLDYHGGIYEKARTLKYIYDALKRTSPDVVLSFGEIFNSLTVVACKLLKIKVVLSDRSSPLVSQGRVNDLLKTMIYPFANAIIAQTEFAKTVFVKKKYNRNIYVIANPLKNIDRPENSFLETEEKKVIVTVGRLVESKNHIDLIQNFNLINKKEWRLYIVGGGPLFDYYASVISSLGLKESVFLVGATDEVDYWLSKADIFAYASLTEGFPNALSEAMAFPLACIAYDCIAGPSDIIQDGENGILIPLHDSQAFRDNLCELMEDEGLRKTLRKNALKNADRFSIKFIGDQYLNALLQ